MPSSLLKFVKPLSVKIGGRRYPVVKIGNQLWMAENLDYKFDVNGSQIPIGGSGSPSTPHAWYYNNNETDYGIDGTYKCGLLYNWYAAKYLDDNKATLLPEGWHVPSKTEWETLVSYVGINPVTKLKERDNTIIQGFPSNWNGTNDYGFSLLPAGYRNNSNFGAIGQYTFYWDFANSGSTTAEYIVYGTGDTISYDSRDKSYSLSVRLVKSLT